MNDACDRGERQPASKSCIPGRQQSARPIMVTSRAGIGRPSGE